MLNLRTLTDKQLIGLVIRERENEDITDRLFKEFDSNLASVVMESDPTELINLRGIGEVRALQIKALGELSRRLGQKQNTNLYKISSPADVANLVLPEMRFLKQEVLRLILLNTKNFIISNEIISMGSINSSIVSPGIVLKAALKKSASSFIVIHNHPSGDPTESQEDVNITRRLFEAGKLVGIDLLDHIIIGDGTYVSLKEKGII